MQKVKFEKGNLTSFHRKNFIIFYLVYFYTQGKIEKS